MMFVCFLFFVILLVYIAKWDFPNPQFSYKPLSGRRFNWDIHHDEKLIIPDAVGIYRNTDVSRKALSDYIPYSVSAAFGLLPPLLLSISWKLFGFNTRSARLISSINAGIILTQLIYLSQLLLPDIIAISFIIIYCFNIRFISIIRLNIIENLSITLLLSVLIVYLNFPEIFLSHYYVFYFFTAAFFWVKPNIPFYLYTLIFFITLFIPLTIKEHLYGFLFVFLGVLLFEGAHVLLLNHYNRLRGRYKNLFGVFFVHSGKDSSAGIHYKTFFFPAQSRVFRTFLYELFSYLLPRKHEGIILRQIMTITLIPILFVSFLGLIKNIDLLFLSVLFFVLFQLIINYFFMYYAKRGFYLIPLVWIILQSGLGYDNFLLSNEILYSFFIINLIIYTISFIFWQLKQSLWLWSDKQLADAFTELPEDLKEWSKIYSHLYAFRFFWQLPVTYISGDDQYLHNDDIVHRANSNGEWLIISLRGGIVFPEQLSSWKLITYWNTTEVISDIPDSYFLFKRTKINKHISKELTQLFKYKQLAFFPANDVAHVMSNFCLSNGAGKVIFFDNDAQINFSSPVYSVNNIDFGLIDAFIITSPEEVIDSTLFEELKKNGVKVFKMTDAYYESHHINHYIESQDNEINASVDIFTNLRKD